MHSSRNSNSDILLISMNSTKENNSDQISSPYGICDQEMMLSATSLVAHDISSLKSSSDSLRTDNSSVDFLVRNDFMHDISDDVRLNLQDMAPRFRSNRILNSTQKISEDVKNISPYSLKSLNNEIQDLSFSDELRSLTRTIPNVSSFNQCYYKPVGPSVDIYNTDFSNEFSTDNFANSLPSTSAIFAPNDTNSPYAMTENTSDDLLLNSIELNENEKLILSNEELAMLTQGKQGSCLELILNNGEVIYAVIDSENEYNPSSPRLLQVSKEILSPDHECSASNEIETDVNHITEPQFNNSIPNSSDFNSRSPQVNDFNTPSDDYRSVISTSLSKSINSSSITNGNFSLSCDFPTNGANHFSDVMSTYQSVVAEKSNVVYTESLLSSTSESTNERQKKVSGLHENSKIKPVSSKLDYFPSAVNSIVVSETGKKYPKKYSFYSNNFSSFLNQEPFEKNNRSNVKNLPSKTLDINHSSVVNDKSNINIEREPNDINENITNSSMLSDSSVMNVINQTVNQISQSEKVTSPVVKNLLNNNENISEHLDSLTNNRSPVVSTSSDTELSFANDRNMKMKYLNSRTEQIVNSICDRAVQSRARASLPLSYLSINRIKLPSNNKKIVYGVFARKTIPSRTQFGPVEGVLIKQEGTICGNDDENVLQLTVETEKGIFFKLDVSNEDICNWMKFVRPATSYKEQNLILSQQESNLYFTTIEIINPKQELLVWYSAWYAQSRNYKLLTGDPSIEILYENNQFKCNNNTPMSNEESISTSIFDPNENNAEVNGICETQNNESCTYANQNSVGENYCANMENKEANSKNKMSKSQSSPRKCDKSKKSLWLCTYCDLTFSNSSVMNLHILVHAVNNVEKTDSAIPKVDTFCKFEKYVCPQCNEEFLEKKYLITHVSKHGLRVQRWNDKKSIEPVIEDDINSENNFDETLELTTYECQPCNKTFKNPVALQIHKRFHSDDSPLECPMCEMTFKKLTDMKEHVHTHAIDGIFTCPHCPRKYNRYKYIRKHIRSCHSKVTYCCKLCKKSCKSQHKLRNHMLKHSDEREFLCAICGKLFKRMDKLSEHVKNMHSEEREKKRIDVTSSASNKGKPLIKKSFKKKLPSKVLRLITENVNDYFYKCYICNVGFKRRGMLVNHLNSFHPGVSLDTIPELNVPILKAYCNFYCLYCDKVYKSNSKRKEHIIKSHPGAKIPGNLERGSVLNDPYSKHVGSVISNPFNCEFCYRQYASRAKLLSHHRKNHADLLPADLKAPRNWNSQKRKKKNDVKFDNPLQNETSGQNIQESSTLMNDLTLKNVEFSLENDQPDITVNIVSQNGTSLQNTTKENVSDVNQQIVNLSNLLNEELRNSATQEQYLKILQSSNGITIAQADENSTALLQQILSSYSFSNS